MRGFVEAQYGSYVKLKVKRSVYGGYGYGGSGGTGGVGLTIGSGLMVDTMTGDNVDGSGNNVYNVESVGNSVNPKLMSYMNMLPSLSIVNSNSSTMITNTNSNTNLL